MTIAVETLGKIERRLTISISLAEVREEVEKRLKIRARTVKAPGFRQGKVPMKMVAAQFGYQVETEVLNDKVGRAFNDAVAANNLRVAGYPKIDAKNAENGSGNEVTGVLLFDATFEIYPDVTVGDLSAVDISQVKVNVSDAEIDKTIDVLRKQRVHYHAKGEQSAHGDGGEPLAQKGDRVTLDFVGKIDGQEFQGGKADNYVFVLGEGTMLPEFEAAALGLKVGDIKTFPLPFPADYHGKEVAGKTAEFTITLKKIEWAHLPEVDSEFAKTLGVPDGDVQKMREGIKENLEREVERRVKAKNKDAVMDALIQVSDLEVPKALVNQDVRRLSDMTRNDMLQRGMKVKDVPLPEELFVPQAERRVRLGLILAEVVKVNALQAKPEQVKAQVEEFAQSYENPAEVVKYYYADRNRLAEVEALVLEDNVVNYVLGQAKAQEKHMAFDELMENRAAA